MRSLLTICGAAALVAAAVGACVAHDGTLPARTADTEVVVSLGAPPLARTGRAGAARVDAQQQAFRRELTARIPVARTRWRYRLVLNGFSVVLPQDRLGELEAIPGVRHVYASTSYGPQAVESGGSASSASVSGAPTPPVEIGAPVLWGPGLVSAGQGMKIGIIDTGLDQRHPFFNPSGYTMPAGFPKGQVGYTTAKVIVARAFPPPGARSRYADVPFDPTSSGHGTHVAGIAAGNANTRAVGGRIVSGIAPRAYLGNYKALTATESGLSPNGNSPELVAAIEAAVRDGMDVINLSIGESEVEPSRDVVARALDAAAAAGVVPVVAAGNEFGDFGPGSVSSPGSAAAAITVGAVEDGSASTLIHADFSSVGPAPISLRLKPDVAAPGVDVLSSVPGGWSALSGTSMATPHVAGAAALLRERHPDWSVAQIKAALIETGNDTLASDASSALAGPPVVGGGVVWLPASDEPLVFATPANLSWGLLPRLTTVTTRIALADAGGGAGSWTVSLERLRTPVGTTVTVPPLVDVPGTLAVEVATSAAAAEGDVSGYVVLQRGEDTRRIPFWSRVSVPRLEREHAIPLTRPGVHTGTTRGRPALVSSYRYPANPGGVGVTRTLAGPEVVYRILVRGRVANVGVVVTRLAPGSRVEPRLVAARNEDRLTGVAGLPINGNPYLDAFQTRVPAVGALLPRPGEYDAVFDSATRAGAGRFTFRFWVNDVTPPTARVRGRVVPRGRPLLVAASDAGSGVYPASIVATVDGSVVGARFRGGVIHILTRTLAVGRHRLRLQVSDYQEAKNDENVSRILQNTRVLTATFSVRAP